MVHRDAHLLVRVEQDAESALVFHVVLVGEASESLVLLAQRFFHRQALNVEVAQFVWAVLIVVDDAVLDCWLLSLTLLDRGVELLLQALDFVSQRLDRVLERIEKRERLAHQKRDATHYESNMQQHVRSSCSSNASRSFSAWRVDQNPLLLGTATACFSSSIALGRQQHAAAGLHLDVLVSFRPCRLGS